MAYLQNQWVLAKKFRQVLGCLVDPGKTYFGRLQAPQHQRTIVGRHTDPKFVHDPVNILCDIFIADTYTPHDHVGMAGQVLRQGLNDNIDTKI